jgi:hypothetical protein
MRTNSNVGVTLLASKQFCTAGRAAFITGDRANGEKRWGQDFDGAIVGSAIAYRERCGCPRGRFTHIFWPTKIVTAKVVVLGLETSQ